MTTLAVLQGQVETQIKRDDKSSAVIRAINDAIRDITLTVRPHEMTATQTITTASADVDYALEDDPQVLAIQSVVITNVGGSTTVPQPVEPGNLWDFQMRSRDTTNDIGTPKRWHRRGNTLFLYNQVPDDNAGSNYTVEVLYIKAPTLLSAAADVSPLNDEWDEAVVCLASAKMFRFFQDPQNEQAMNSAYQYILSIRQLPMGLESEYFPQAALRFY